jgi:hypothetical protein
MQRFAKELVALQPDLILSRLISRGWGWGPSTAPEDLSHEAQQHSRMRSLYRDCHSDTDEA